MAKQEGPASNAGIQNRVFFAYTDYETRIGVSQEISSNGDVLSEKIRRMGPTDRATIAVKKDGKNLLYGVSICSSSDTWDKEKGRSIAEERLEKKFGKIKLDTPYIKSLIDKKGEQNTILFLTRNLKESVQHNINKFKRKIEAFNKKTGAVISKRTVKKAAVKKRAAARPAKK